MSQKKFVSHRLDKTTILYRGKFIILHQNVKAGYCGRYKMGNSSSSTLKGMKKYIDELCAAKNIESFKDAVETKKIIAEWLDK